MIEEKIILGYSYRSIEDLYSDTDMVLEQGESPQWLPRVGRMSIRNHYAAGHMPIEAAEMRRITENRARSISRAVEDGDTLVDQVSLAEAVLARTHERLVKGEIEPEIKDGLAAAKLLQDLDEGTESGVTAEAWTQAMTQYFETARRFMPPGMWHQFTQALTGNPILRAIEQKLAPQDPDDVIDVEYDVHGEN